MGSSKKAPKDPFASGKKAIASGVEDFLASDFQTFDTIDPARRTKFATNNLGIPLSSGAQQAIRSGGFAPLNQQQQSAINQFRGLSGGDAAFNSAIQALNDRGGINALRGINVGSQQRQAESALRGLNFSALNASNTGRNLGAFDIGSEQEAALAALQNASRFFNLLESEDPNARFLRETGSGAFLGPDSNPFLRDAVEAAQRPVIDEFTRRIQPQLASQFGGGFGVGGSAAINAQRLAANDLTRNLSDSATRTFAANFEAERQRQEAANQFLSNLRFQRGSALGQLGLQQAQSLADTRLGFTGQELSRRTSLDNLLAQQARARVQGQLDRAQSLAQSGLGFTQAGIQRGIGLQNAINQRGATLAQIGTARGNQRLAAAEGLLRGGTLQQQNDLLAAEVAARQFNAKRNSDLVQLQLAAPLVGGGTTIGAGAGGSRASGAIGGALGGAATGAALGSVVPGLGTVTGAIGGGVLGGLAGIL